MDIYFFGIRPGKRTVFANADLYLCLRRFDLAAARLLYLERDLTRFLGERAHEISA